MKNVEELEKQIKRFQSFKERTGTDKTSSFSVHLSFNCWDDKVYVEFGGYNVGSWSRHEQMETTWDNLVEDITKKVDEADRITKYERYCPSCQEYTDHDPETGKCKGWMDWGGKVYECDEMIEGMIEITEEEYELFQKLKKDLDTFKSRKSGAYFICGEAGEKDKIGLPEGILVCPTYGLDGFAYYKKAKDYTSPGW